MMIRLKAAFLCCSLLLAAAFTGCAADTAASSAPEPEKPSPSVQTTAQAEITATAVTKLRIQAGDRVFTAQLEDTPAAQALAAAMPMTLNMDEMNGNEKYFFLSDALPTNAERPGSITAGDLMLYGDNCLVLFYESFQSAYSYTRLGSITDTAGLADALGIGSVEVSFSLAE